MTYVVRIHKRYTYLSFFVLQNQIKLINPFNANDVMHRDENSVFTVSSSFITHIHTHTDRDADTQIRSHERKKKPTRTHTHTLDEELLRKFFFST